jgi:hypothetical protein
MGIGLEIMIDSLDDGSTAAKPPHSTTSAWSTLILGSRGRSWPTTSRLRRAVGDRDGEAVTL